MASGARKKNIWLSLILVSTTVSIMLARADVSFGQQDLDLFDTTTLEKRLAREFHLSHKDIKRLHPFIKHENENVILTYGRYCTEKSDDFISLWNRFRADRMAFETNLAKDFSPRQKNALRAARSEFELRSLNVWLDDYLSMLTELLELDSFRLSCVIRVFENETAKRYKQILAEARAHRPMTTQWLDLTDERERYIRLILDDDQLRTYLTLGKPAEMLVGQMNNKAGI